MKKSFFPVSNLLFFLRGFCTTCLIFQIMSAPVQCPVHPDVHLIEDHRAGDLVCPACGLVVGDRYVFDFKMFLNREH